LKGPHALIVTRGKTVRAGKVEGGVLRAQREKRKSVGGWEEKGTRGRKRVPAGQVQLFQDKKKEESFEGGPEKDLVSCEKKRAPKDSLGGKKAGLDFQKHAAWGACSKNVARRPCDKKRERNLGQQKERVTRVGSGGRIFLDGKISFCRRKKKAQSRLTEEEDGEKTSQFAEKKQTLCSSSGKRSKGDGTSGGRQSEN